MALSLVARRCAVRSLASSVGVAQKHTLPDLSYDYGALAPHVAPEIMQLHHSKHHQTYVNNLNITEEKIAECLVKGDSSAALALGAAHKFNLGGHINHSIFWQNLSPNGGGDPTGALAEAITSQYGDFESFKQRMSAAAVSVQGSGWAWLGYNKETKGIAVAACPNQDPLQTTTGLVPLLGIDVWEHAYYLQYNNVRPDYVKAIWNVVNWADVSARFEAAQQ